MPTEDTSTNGESLSAAHEARLREGFDEVIKSMPEEKKSAYMEAVEKAPCLFEAECKPLHFIQATNYDLWEAGYRMTEYWSKRKELFGDRAFRKMSQVGDGTLSSNDLVTLHAGFPVFIPDTNGGKGPIIFADRRRRLPLSSRESLLRCFMYILTVASEYPSARLSSLHFLSVFLTPGVADMADFDRELAQMALSMITIAPCRVSIHLLQHYPPPEKRSIFEGAFQLGMTMFRNFSRHTVHSGHTMSTILDSLASLGLHKSNLPSTIGGDWSFAQFTEWCKSRAMKETSGSARDINHSPYSSARSSPISDNERVNEVEIIIKSFPIDEKEAYLEAMQRAPDLFLGECRVQFFIEACDHDHQAAAKRICGYWKERKDLFGDRAFLPMLQTGDGALSPDDIIVLNAGFAVYIERRHAMGNAPCPILFHDRRRTLPSSSREANWRCCFYLLTVASEDRQARLRGLMCMVLLITKRVSDFDQVYARRAVSFLKLMPCKVTLHCLKSLPKGGKRTLLDHVQTAGLNILKTFGEFSVHVEDTPGQLVKELEQIGVPNTHLPSTIGGLWTYETFTRWCRTRASNERASNTGQKIGSAGNGSSSDTRNDASAVSTSTVEPSSLATDKAARKRLLNVMHSRQKRERRKKEMDNMKIEKDKLGVENERLKKENVLLQGLMQDAVRVVRDEVIGSLPRLLSGMDNPVLTTGGQNARASQSESTIPAVEGRFPPTVSQPPVFTTQNFLNSSGVEARSQGLFSQNQGQAAAVTQPRSARATSALGDTVQNALSLPQEEQRALLEALLEQEEKSHVNSSAATRTQLQDDAIASQLLQLQQRATLDEQQEMDQRNGNLAAISLFLAQQQRQTHAAHEDLLNSAAVLSQTSDFARLAQATTTIPSTLPPSRDAMSLSGIQSHQQYLAQQLYLQQQQQRQQQQQALMLQEQLSHLQNNRHTAGGMTASPLDALNSADLQRLLLLQHLQRQQGNL